MLSERELERLSRKVAALAMAIRENPKNTWYYYELCKALSQLKGGVNFDRAYYTLKRLNSSVDLLSLKEGFNEYLMSRSKDGSKEDLRSSSSDRF
jgi:hypothetical protein